MRILSFVSGTMRITGLRSGNGIDRRLIGLFLLDLRLAGALEDGFPPGRSALAVSMIWDEN